MTMPARGVFHRAAARSTRTARAAAATFRSWRFIVGVVRLPNVPMSNGVFAVSAMTTVMVATGVFSSSATAWVSDVRMF